jgi:hypothetical protein
LKRYLPQLRFDSGEDFFPLSVRAITNIIGNKLARDSDETIAERLPGGKGLRLSYLRGGEKYPNGDEIKDDDKLMEFHFNKDSYLKSARELQADSRYSDRMYGRVIPIKENDKVTGAWLQYWFFYYYNDYPRVGGDHEGDWEMIQLKLDSNAVPVFAVYSQHGHGTKCSWEKIQKVDGRPIVYVALGSHANYFRAGAHGQDFDNDGAKHHTMKWLITIGSSSPGWLNWPGFWGGTKGVLPKIDTDSPKGPKMQKRMWDPETFAAEAEVDDDCK